MDTTSRSSFPEPDPAPVINAVIHGPVHGQVAIGEHIYQYMWHVHGDVIVRAPAQPQPPRARTKPVYLLPRVFPGFLDRQLEISSVVGTLMDGEPVHVHGEDGVGKTSLLRAVVHHETARSFRDGVVWIRANAHPAMDLLQVLFEAFYEWDVTTKPTEGQLRNGLRSVQALVVCDDIQLSREDLEMVLDAAPECSFLVSAGERLLWSSGRSVSLSGLPLVDAEALVERELGRSLADGEREAYGALHSSLGGHPLQLLQAAALVRSGDQDFAGIASELRAGGSGSEISRHLTASLPDAERRMLAAVSAFADAPVRPSMAGMIAGDPASGSVLESLMDRHLVIRKQTGGGGEGYAAAGETVIEHLADLDLMQE